MADNDLNPKTDAGAPPVPSGTPQWESLKSEGRSAISRLRLLDFDDLFLLGHLLAGATIAATAKQLGLTQPAITQRVRKIERVFAEPILQKVGRHVRLTKEGRAICVKAADALALMREVTTEPAGKTLTIGAVPTLAHSWLWPALAKLHEADPTRLFHCSVGSADELLGLLDAGSIDALLTSAPPSGGGQGVIELGAEEYALTAKADLAPALTGTGALVDQILLEVDRSYPLLARLDSHARAITRFKGVWFLGDVQNVLTATLQGQGVGVLPMSLAGPALAAGKLVSILPELELAPETVRLLYRQDRGTDDLLAALAARLRRD